ncbi:MAG: glycosyltransferase family 29 protein [Promethearchaeota archaeon]|jgi:hypothetical protein
MDKKYKDMCIVGNGPIDIKCLNGKIIDSHSCVARMNNYDTGIRFASYVGVKTNIWVTSLYKDINDSGDDVERIFVPLYGEDRYYFQEKILKKHNEKVEFIPDEYFKELCGLIPNPSTGISFLFWMYKEFGKIDDDKVFGFSFFNEDLPHHYFDSDRRCLHNGEMEERLYRNMLIKNKEKL